MDSQYTMYKGKDFGMTSYEKNNCLGPINLVFRKLYVFATCVKEDQDLGWLKKYEITWSNLTNTLNFGFGKVQAPRMIMMKNG